MPVRHDRSYHFDRQQVERVTDAIKRVETGYYYQRQWSNARAFTASAGIVEAIVTTAITACSSLTYGSGQAQVYIQSGVSGNAILDGTFPNPVPVLNWFVGSGTIAIGKHILICQRGSYFLLVSGDC